MKKRGAPPRPVVALMVLVGMASVLGCPGNDHPPPIAATDLAHEVTAAYCERAVACGEFLDATTCQTSVKLDYQQLLADVTAGIVRYDAQQAGDCVDQIKRGQGPGSCSLSVQLSTPPTKECMGAIVGTLERDAPCLTDNECAAGLCVPKACLGQETCCAGSCGFVVADGGDCSPLGAVCGGGSYCSTTDHVCTKKKKTCEDDPNACEPGTLCVPDDTGSRSCRALPAEKASCLVASGCDSIRDYCDPGSLTCKPRASVGQPCAATTPCLPHAECDENRGVCVERFGAGEECASSKQCQGTLACIEDTCQQPASASACSTLQSPNPPPSGVGDASVSDAAPAP